MTSLYLPIGEIYEHKELGYITPQINERGDCKGCVFFHAGNCKGPKAVFKCTNVERQDRKDVIFTKA